MDILLEKRKENSTTGSRVLPFILLFQRSSCDARESVWFMSGISAMSLHMLL